MKLEVGSEIANPTIRNRDEGWIFDVFIVTNITQERYELDRKTSGRQTYPLHKNHFKEKFDIKDYLGSNYGVWNHYPMDQIEDVIEQLNYEIPKGKRRKAI